MNDIWVEKVVCDLSGRAYEVEVGAGNIILCFGIGPNKKMVLTGKYKPGAQIYDPEEFWVHPNLFREASRRAAAILFKLNTKSKSNKDSSQQNLVF